jgi:AraC-like DNA-binding protein
MESINKQFDFTIDGCTAALIINNGLINSSGNYFDIMHCHPFYEIHFIVFGDNNVRSPDGSISAETGDIFIVPPGQLHCFLPVANTGEHKRTAFWLDVKINDTEQTGTFIFDRIHSITKITKIKNTFDASRTMEEIERELIQKKPCYEENLLHIFASLIIQICRSIEIEDMHGIQANKSHQSLVLLIEEYMLQHYKENCSIEDLSVHLHISRRQMTRQIKSLFSKSFRQMLLEIRMRMANWLIEDKDIPFEMVASKVGYGSLPAFYHAYHEFYGIPPGEYRKQNRNVEQRYDKKKKEIFYHF